MKLLYIKGMAESNKKINYGIEILRFFCCLWVVIVHCSNIKREHEKYIRRNLHVPTFIILSFYFYYRMICKREIKKVIFRFQRLLIPYIIYPSIILLINNFLHSIFSFGQYDKNLTIKDFYVQILLGSQYYKIFWFQFNLIFSSLVFAIISFLFKNYLIYILEFLGIIAFYLHISGINFNFFKPYKGYPSGDNLGSLIELLPISVIGCIFNSLNLLLITKNFSKYFYFILTLILFILFKYDIFLYKPKGFRYPNVSLNIFGSIILFLLFSSLSSEKMKNKIFICVIQNITKFTGGIYYTHQIFRDYLTKYNRFFEKRNYINSFIIYIICYFFSFIGMKLFKNNNLKYLFM